MLAKCVVTILELKNTNWFVIICSRRPHNNKTGHFTSRKERGLRNVQKWKNVLRSVQNYCFSMWVMQMYALSVEKFVLIDWVRPGWTGKCLARGHGVCTEWSEVRAPWPHFIIWPPRFSFFVFFRVIKCAIGMFTYVAHFDRKVAIYI